MKRVLLFVSVFILFFVGCSKSDSYVSDGYWPDSDWRTCLPEQVGMDSEKLYKMLLDIKDRDIAVDNVFVVKNGYVVLDVCRKKSDYLHEIQSCTKSITSALLGIAIEKDYISSAETKVLDYFDDEDIENIDERKEAMTIEHLLSMSSGLEWDGFFTSDMENYTNQMYISSNPVKYVLDKPMVYEPGTKFVYNTGASQVLSAIIENTTETDIKTFADNTLFKELNITEYMWYKTRSGEYGGGFGLNMCTEDMAKLGYLYLKDGVWNGERILPENWVEVSTIKHVDVNDFSSDGYGYQWWINSFGGYSARGLHGQYIFVMPEDDLVVVFQSSFDGVDEIIPINYMELYLLPAVVSDNSIAKNNEYSDLLESICIELND